MGLDNICTKRFPFLCQVVLPLSPLFPFLPTPLSSSTDRSGGLSQHFLQLLRSLCPLGAGEGSDLALQWPHKPERKSCDLVVL